MNAPAPARSLLAPLLDALARGDANAVIAEGKRVLRQQPDMAPALLGQLAEQLHQRGADDMLLLFYAVLIDVLPVSVLQIMGDQAQAITNKRRITHAVKILELIRLRAPDDLGIMQQLARRYQMLGRDEEAMVLLERALRLYPDNEHIDQVHFMHIVSRMIHSRFKDGMDEYDIRFKVLTEQWREMSIPRWKGEKLEGKRLYIWGEQGVGDIMMYTTFLPYLQSLGPADICMSVIPRLRALLERSHPGIRFVEHFPGVPCAAESEPFDYSMPLADVLRYCLPYYAPREHPALLQAHPALLAEARASLARLGPKRKIGISWFTTNVNSAPVRDIPLPLWEETFLVPGCVFFSLQHGEGVGEQVQQMAQRGFPVLIDNMLDPVLDLEKLIALTAALDEVISIQATAGHIGGALGVPTTVLRSRALDFSWAYEPCPWYGSVHIEKQDEPVVWEPVMARVAAGLRQRMERRPSA